jgi:hypothetical protein
MGSQKGRQILLSFLQKDGQIATVHDRHPQGPCLSHKRSELGMQFRCAAGEIKGLQLLRAQHLGDQGNGDGIHLL